MIIGIGTDVISIDRVKFTLEKFGDTFLEKYFTKTEISYAKNKDKNIESQAIASSWAVKESVGKALGTGIRGDIRLDNICLERDNMGKPSVKLTGGADIRAKEISKTGKYNIFVSCSHDAGVAIAYVILEQA